MTKNDLIGDFWAVFEQYFIFVSPDPEADMLQNIGQRHVFGLEGLPLFLELVCQADPPAFLR